MFNPYLIVIKNQENILGIHEIKYNYFEKDYYIEIIDDKKNIIFKDKLTNETLINLDISLEIVYINYYEDFTNKLFLSEKLDLNNFNKVITQIDNFYITKLIDKICYEMDNPEGSTEEIEFHTLMLKQSAFEKKARYYVEDKIKQILLRENKFTKNEIDDFVCEIYADFYGMGILQELDDDKNISEITVNAYVYPEFHCNVYFTRTNQEKRKYDKTFKSLEELLNVFSRAISFSKKELNNLENAIIETTRANGDRVNIIIPEASESYVLNIRKFSNFVPTKENMLNVGTINKEIDLLMKVIVEGRANIGIGGRMGVGKTTFINYLLGYTKPIERKVVISSVREIDVSRTLKNHDIVFLNVDDDKGFTFNKLMKTSLRTTSDRIIIPEARGEEFKQIYEANLKTKGNMFTVHAFDSSSFLDVCADMYTENFKSDISFIKNKIAKSIDFIIIMRLIDNKVKIKSISEVLFDENNQFKGLNELFYWDFGDKNKQGIGYKKTENKISKNMKRRLFEEGVSYDLLEKL